MPVLKHHHIRFKKCPAKGSVKEWESLMGEVHGVAWVGIDKDKMDVYVEYDLEKCCEEAIENWMVKMGFVLDDSFLEKIKRGLIHFTEENARENLRAKSHSCHDVEETDKKGHVK